MVSAQRSTLCVCVFVVRRGHGFSLGVVRTRLALDLRQTIVVMFRGGGMVEDGAPIMFQASSAVANSAVSSNGPQQPSAEPVVKVRSQFPESWIWADQVVE